MAKDIFSRRVTLSVRVPKALWQKLERHTAVKGINKTDLVIRCLEKEIDEDIASDTVWRQLQEIRQELAKLTPSSSNSSGSGSSLSSGLPWEVLEKVLLSSAFCEALLQKSTWHQESGEWTKMVTAARSQAVAETNYVKEKLYGLED